MLSPGTLCKHISIVTTVLIFLLTLLLTVILKFTDLVPTRYTTFDLNDPSINQPDLEAIHPGGLLTLLITLGITIAAFTALYLHSPRSGSVSTCLIKDLYPIILIIIFGNLITLLLTSEIKHFAGGLRPSFIQHCQPNQTIVDIITEAGVTWVGEKWVRKICKVDDMDYRQSFPSAHASQAAYTMMLTILALQNTRFPSEFVAVQAMLQLGAATYCTFVCFSRIADYHHHWWDVLAGAILGGAVAAFVWYGYIKKRTFTAPPEGECTELDIDLQETVEEERTPLKPTDEH